MSAEARPTGPAGDSSLVGTVSAGEMAIPLLSREPPVSASDPKRTLEGFAKGAAMLLRAMPAAIKIFAHSIIRSVECTRQKSGAKRKSPVKGYGQAV